MSDPPSLVERLRLADYFLVNEAADRIEALEVEVIVWTGTAKGEANAHDAERALADQLAEAVQEWACDTQSGRAALAAHRERRHCQDCYGMSIGCHQEPCRCALPCSCNFTTEEMPRVDGTCERHDPREDRRNAEPDLNEDTGPFDGPVMNPCEEVS